MNFCLRPKETNMSHCGESAFNHTFKILLRKGLVTNKSFWNFVKPSLTNKSWHTQNDIMLIDNGRDHPLISASRRISTASVNAAPSGIAAEFC